MKELEKFTKCNHKIGDTIDSNCIHCNFAWCLARIRYLEKNYIKPTEDKGLEKILRKLEQSAHTEAESNFDYPKDYTIAQAINAISAEYVKRTEDKRLEEMLWECIYRKNLDCSELANAISAEYVKKSDIVLDEEKIERICFDHISLGSSEYYKMLPTNLAKAIAQARKEIIK